MVNRKIEEVFDYKGFKCVVILYEMELPHYTSTTPTKWRCGYVGVSSKHQLYKKDYSEIDELINIHGGLTFSGDFSDKKQLKSLKDVWYFGFDCNHFEDNLNKWNFEKVKKEVKKLARQFTTKNLILSVL